MIDLGRRWTRRVCFHHRPMALARFAALLSIVGLAMAASAAARNPRLEQIALNRADGRFASAALLRQVDLVGVSPGWRRLTTIPGDAGPICPWQNYSAYTVTGRAEADFQPVTVGDSGFIGSSVDLFASTGDALGKFTMDTHPGTASCEGEALRKAFGSRLNTASARRLPAPRLGVHAAAYEFVYSQSNRTPARIYVDIVEFVRGRAIGLLETTNFNRPGDSAGRLRLARLIEERLPNAR